MVGGVETIGFSELKQGMRGRVVSVDPHAPALLRLQEMGLTEGAEFLVDKVAPLGDPVEIFLRGYRLCLRKHEAVGILVEVIK
ncbi:MAG TPA: FeoA domain-containing protein [Fimbriimonadaceae bacterium]|nr:FeoA domain-containing protein [Fimbriimonadaceae bacterium]HRJ96429.1 FeoA domain-containing protein [Fimbriimonadaceae bacterium]